MMNEYLEKRLYTYRRSHSDYQKYVVVLTIAKFIFSATGIPALFYMPLSLLSLLTGCVEILDKALSTSERKESYLTAYKFYKELLTLCKQNAITPEEAMKREDDFVKTLSYLPREGYYGEVKLNGYKFLQT